MCTFGASYEREQRHARLLLRACTGQMRAHRRDDQGQRVQTRIVQTNCEHPQRSARLLLHACTGQVRAHRHDDQGHHVRDHCLMIMNVLDRPNLMPLVSALHAASCMPTLAGCARIAATITGRTPASNAASNSSVG
eukprot:CAMPEP_0179852292 /NCGR_PEP_ID=MMETSP0982-20121206/8718_1 /TAXON_ID=483367 /ORGANISM="non described non described, Strain CCMP 2436" /LENGTH=135 /DNA_ID=CAMNT_0021737893 /DNA_START=160 /DNA_END=568 /DNA_ORIENTATION=+